MKMEQTSCYDDVYSEVMSDWLAGEGALYNNTYTTGTVMENENENEDESENEEYQKYQREE